MKTNITRSIYTFVLFTILALALPAYGQGTAFTYQGRLNGGTNPVTGKYDLTFQLFNASSGGSQIGSTITDAGAGITNGLFTATLDFGGVFGGTPYWLQINVRTNGAGSYSTLSPRQPVTPAPYAIMANSASNLLGMLPTTQLGGTIPVSQLSGTPAAAVNFTGNLAGDVTGPQSATLIAANAVGNTKLASDAASLVKVSGGAMVNSGGNVGIGTANPTRMLDVNGQIGLSYDGKLQSYGNNDLFIEQKATNKDIVFYDTREAMRIKTNGYVGIGKNNPATALDVNGNINAAGYQGPFGTYLTVPGNSNTTLLAVGWDSLNGDHVDLTVPGNTWLPNANTNLVRITTSGKVGINNYNPSVALDVNGTVKATSFSGSGAGLTGIAAASVTIPPGMALIPAGSFTMGDTLDGLAVPTNTYVSAFYMDVNLVSYGQWKSVYYWATNHGYGFVNMGGGKAANHPACNMDWYDCVKWCNARSQQAGKTPAYYTDAGLTQVYTNGEVTVYVNWPATGYRLPTEAEWEKAARGGLSGQRFPWGNVIDQCLANYWWDPATNEIYYTYDLGQNGCNYNAFLTNGAPQPWTSPVGYFTPNGYGLYDMAGNVYEWCWDWWSLPYTPSGGTDPHGPSSGSQRVFRGGNYFDGANDCRVAMRESMDPTRWTWPVTGFRCAQPVGQ